MHDPMTKEELEAMEEIEDSDKDLIDIIVEAEVGTDDGDIRVRALRGYLLSQFLEIEPDDQFRDAVTDTAAGFSDGWTYCLEYGVPERLWMGS